MFASSIAHTCSTACSIFSDEIFINANSCACYMYIYVFLIRVEFPNLFQFFSR